MIDLLATNKQDYCNIPVTIRRRSYREAYDMRKWLYENIDPECYDAEDWGYVNAEPGSRRIWFSNQRDAVLFSLMWA